MMIPPGHETWWHTERQLWWRDFDALGHLTAGSYALLYQDALADFVTEAWQDPHAPYVAARLDISYLREILPDQRRVRAHVRVIRIGRAGFGAMMVLRAGDRVWRPGTSHRTVAGAAPDR